MFGPLDRALNRLVARCPFFIRVIRRLKLGSRAFRVSIGAVHRPYYAHILYNAADLAKKLGYPAISVLEYGVAGGNGLLELEDYAATLEKHFSIQIEIYGFDTGKGLPPTEDYRDLPYIFSRGFFAMDEVSLKKKLKKAKLVLGDIAQTSTTFFEKFNPAPIGAIAHDMDLYTATSAGLNMLARGSHHFLPRIFCYFDDTVDDHIALFNDWTGERLAIHEFNQQHADIKLSAPYYLKNRPYAIWHNQIWIGHFFKHEKYNQFIGTPNDQRPLL